LHTNFDLRLIMFSRTTPYDNYISPSNNLIRDCCEKFGLKSYSPSLVRDIANVASGGEVLPSVEWRDSLNEMHVIKYHENVCEFLRGINFNAVPGDTPLEQAVTLLKTLYNSDDIESPVPGLGEDDLILPIFSTATPNSMIDKINDIFEDLESMDDVEKELIHPDGKSMDNALVEANIASDMVRGRHWWLKISRNLESLTRFRLTKSNKVEPDIEGEDIELRQIRGFEEMAKIPAMEYALPTTYRIFRVATRATHVHERVSHQDKKQLIYMMIDCSLSMKHLDRMHKAGGILMNRLKAVVSEEAEVHLRFFDYNVYDKRYVAETAEEARQIMKVFAGTYPSGGGTDIAASLREGIKDVKNLMQQKTMLERPEMVVVTDGDDNVEALNASMFTREKLRLHSFVVQSDNQLLCQIARQTGGVGVEKL